MALIPKDAAARLTYFETHAQVWSHDPAAVGLSPLRVAAIAAAVEAAKEARTLAAEAANAALAATSAWNRADEAMSRLGAGAIRTIKSYAMGQATPSDEADVYIAAQVEAPNRPGPKRRDQTERNNAVPHVTNVVATPDSQGNIALRWTAVRGATMGAGAGMSYEITRLIDQGRAVTIGVVGGPGPGRTSSTFTDTAVPFGARTIVYRVTPRQNGGVGSSNSTIVQIGSAPGSGTISSRAAA